MKAKKDNRSTSSVSPTKEMFESQQQQQQFKDMPYHQVPPTYDHGISIGGYKPNNLNFLDHGPNGYGVTDPHLLQFNNYKGV